MSEVKKIVLDGKEYSVLLKRYEYPVDSAYMAEQGGFDIEISGNGLRIIAKKDDVESIMSIDSGLASDDTTSLEIVRSIARELFKDDKIRLVLYFGGDYKEYKQV